MIEPIYPFERGILDSVEVMPGRSMVDEFGLVQSDHRFRHRVIVRVADAADRRCNARLSESLTVMTTNLRCRGIERPAIPERERPFFIACKISAAIVIGSARDHL